MVAAFTTLAVFCTAFVGFIGASPVPEPQAEAVQHPCSPNFQGVATYIQAYDTYNRLWVPAGSQQDTVISTLSGGQTKWRVEGTGSPANDYLIKYITPANNLLAQSWGGSTVSLGLVQGSGNPAYEIRCNYCYPPGTIPSTGSFIGGTCNIIDSDTGLYLTETPYGSGEGYLSLEGGNGASNQFFHIVAA